MFEQRASLSTSPLLSRHIYGDTTRACLADRTRRANRPVALESFAAASCRQCLPRASLGFPLNSAAGGPQQGRTTMYGDKAIELLRELKRAPPHLVPPHNVMSPLPPPPRLAQNPPPQAQGCHNHTTLPTPKHTHIHTHTYTHTHIPHRQTDRQTDRSPDAAQPHTRARACAYPPFLSVRLSLCVCAYLSPAAYARTQHVNERAEPCTTVPLAWRARRRSGCRKSFKKPRACTRKCRAPSSELLRTARAHQALAGLARQGGGGQSEQSG